MSFKNDPYLKQNACRLELFSAGVTEVQKFWDTEAASSWISCGKRFRGWFGKSVLRTPGHDRNVWQPQEDIDIFGRKMENPLWGTHLVALLKMFCAQVWKENIEVSKCQNWQKLVAWTNVSGCQTSHPSEVKYRLGKFDWVSYQYPYTPGITFYQNIQMQPPLLKATTRSGRCCQWGSLAWCSSSTSEYGELQGCSAMALNFFGSCSLVLCSKFPQSLYTFEATYRSWMNHYTFVPLPAKDIGPVAVIVSSRRSLRQVLPLPPAVWARRTFTGRPFRPETVVAMGRGTWRPAQSVVKGRRAFQAVVGCFWFKNPYCWFRNLALVKLNRFFPA